MSNEHLKDSRISKLKKGKVKGVGFFEGIRLKITGRRDGARGLPREGEAGRWTSPHLDREVRSYEEFSSRLWGQLQIEAADEYARLGALTDSIAFTQAQMAGVKADLKMALSYDKTPDPIRKHGEEDLTDAQVASRREAERGKRLGHYYRRISELEKKLLTDVDEFTALRNKIVEDNNSNRMICARVKEHLLQRMDVYWNAALRKHPAGDKLSAVPAVEVTSHAEELYMAPHKALLEKAETLSQILSAIGKERE